ncbi:MAG: hypothetical protein IPI83_08050 [Sphingomonadales bacterium]|nr:hypothetical protein [Sphingomonadales bacterium]
MQTWPTRPPRQRRLGTPAPFPHRRPRRVPKRRRILLQQRSHTRWGVARGQIAKTYIVAEAEDGLVLVDQHAAHERLVLERMRRAVEAGEVASRHCSFRKSWNWKKRRATGSRRGSSIYRPSALIWNARALRDACPRRRRCLGAGDIGGSSPTCR